MIPKYLVCNIRIDEARDGEGIPQQRKQDGKETLLGTTASCGISEL